MQNETLLTAQAHPDHDTLGYLWIGYSGAIYFCDSYDPRLGFWMTNVRDPQDRRNVSERAPSRTFHRIHGEVKRQHRDPAHSGYHVLDLLADEPVATAIDAEQARIAPPTHLVLFDEGYARIAARRVREAALRAEA